MGEALTYFLSQFEKLRCLRQTERGEVWLGADASGRPVIYKRLHRTGLPLAKLQAVGQDGSRAGKGPATGSTLWPEVYAFVEADGETHILEEYVPGEPMTRRLEEGRYLTPREAKELLRELAVGLAALHAAGILHRDIKPGNLIEQPGGQALSVRLIDFDAAREMKDGAPDTDTTHLGTRGYAPPEQYGYAATDARSDLYALGKTICELLGPGYQGHLKCFGRFGRLGRHSSLMRVLARATEVDPARRYPSAHALLRDLRYGSLFRLARFAAALIVLLALAIAAYLFYLVQTHPGKIEELEETPALELVRHPEELKPDTSREDVRKKEQQAPPGGTTVLQAGGGDGKPADGKAGAEKKEADDADALKASDEDAASSAPREEVRAQYFFGGNRWDAWTDAFDYPVNNATGVIYIPTNVWKSWDGDDAACYFPDGAEWTVRVHVTNTTKETYSAPTLHMTYDDGAQTIARDYSAPPLTPGGSIDFDIPLAGLAIANPGQEGYIGHEMKLELGGIDHEIFGTRSSVDFIPKERPANFGNW